MSTWSVVALVGMLAAQSPDGPAPSVPSVPSAAPSSPAQPYNPEAPAAAPADTTQPAPAAEPAPAPAQDPAPGTTADASTTDAGGGATAADGTQKKKGFKGFKDIWGGVFVAGIGAGVVVLGGLMGSVAGVFMVFKQIPFPGGEGERSGFTTSAVVGAVFCAMVGLTLVTVGAALVGVSFL